MDNEIIDIEPETAIAKVAPNQIAPASPAGIMMQMASSGGEFDLDKMEKLLGLQERYDANEAKKAYHTAMAAFKADPPRITKDLDNKQYGSKYASLASITKAISPALSAHDLSANWETSQKENGYPEVTCIVTHRQGHAESTTLCAPPDTSGKKNPIQQIISTISYLKKETLLAITGLATHDMHDDDGNGYIPDDKPERPAPNEAEQAVLTAVFEGLFDFANNQERIIDANLLAKFAYENGPNGLGYPTDAKGVIDYLASEGGSHWFTAVTKEI